MIDGGMTWTFFDWSGSEKLKAKGILSTEWLDLTAKARYVSFGGKQARMPLARLEPRLRHCGRRVPDGTAVQCADVWNVSSYRRGRTDRLLLYSRKRPG